MSRLIKIDELLVLDHYYLVEGDNCYFFLDYTAGKGHGHSDGNNLISNFKKDLERYGNNQWPMHHKGEAIKRVGTMLSETVASIAELSETVLVPIPPSKTKEHPHYDARMSRSLQIVRNNLKTDVRELVAMNEDMEPVHKSEYRLKPRELQANMHLDSDLKVGLKRNIILFDDVVTTGAHYVACRDLIHSEFPDIRVFGIFIARRVLDHDDPMIDFLGIPSAE